MDTFAVLLSFLITLVAYPSQSPQGGNTVNIYQEVPEERREHLRRAVEELLEAEKRGDWDKVFELIERAPHGTLKDFMEKSKGKRRLREFLPSSVSFIPPDDSWIIIGCASFVGDARGSGHVSSIHARWRNSRWYLSPVTVSLFKGKGGVRQCSTAQR